MLCVRTAALPVVADGNSSVIEGGVDIGLGVVLDLVTFGGCGKELILIVRRAMARLEPLGDLVGLVMEALSAAVFVVVVVGKPPVRKVGSEEGVTDRNRFDVGSSDDEDPGRPSADVGVSGMRDRVLETGNGGRGMLGGFASAGGGICRSGGE